MDHLNLNPRCTRQKRRSLVSKAASIGSSVIGAAGLVITTQALYVALTTPRLPPPPNSGHDFEEDGLLIRYNSAFTTTTTTTNTTTANGPTTSVYRQRQKQQGGDDGTSNDCEENAGSEFRLVLVGDSPVEGIGNRKHGEALGGQTALAFSKLLRRSVRYWSYGKGGLTARGVEDEMVPLVQRLSRRYNKIDAVVMMCGVNNVLKGHSAERFGKEVRGLLDSLISCCRCQIIVVDLIDFAFLPFLPFPLSKILSWRSQSLQTELEAIVNEYGEEEGVGRRRRLIGMAYMPDIPKLLKNIDNDSLLPQHISTDREHRDSLRLDHFFADDKFHPALLGNAVIGKAIANTYSQLLLAPTFRDNADLTNLS